jgi:diguanylate cyclase
MGIADNPGLLFWHDAAEATREAARSELSSIVEENADLLVATFYSRFMAHEEATAFLSHSVVNERLSHSLRKWLGELVRVVPNDDMSAFDKRQKAIGEIHARLKIPNHLVMEGMSLLKTEMSKKVAALALDKQCATDIIILLGEIIDYSMRLMTAAYVSDTTRRVQTDEAFRLFSLGQDINLERETQRAALMEWSQTVLFSLLGKDGIAPPARLAASPFGLWVRHRGSVLFQGASILQTIERLVNEIDDKVLSAISVDQPAAVTELHRRIDEIKFLLNDLFQSAAHLENGRDPLTRTLNRRFLPSVLGREISLAKNAKTPLSILMADIDHFKTVNDSHGHSAGDTVLSHTAETLLNCVRASDFVFRYGGEEFLIVLVETDREEAMEVAERIRQQIASQSVPLPSKSSLNVTLSLGVATYEGHPDYQYLINAADHALYSAKKQGRNRTAVAVADNT